MPRDGTGNYQVPAGSNPAIAGTTVSADDFNETMADLSAAMTGSLPRNGEAPMTGPFRLPDGSQSTPAFSFNSEASTGFYLPGTGVLGFTVAAGERMRLLNTGSLILGSTSDSGEKLQVHGSTKINGALGVAGASTLTGAVTVTGAQTISSTLGVSGLTSLLAGLAVTGAATISTTLGVTGATTLAALSATTGSFSSTLGVTGATTMTSLTTSTQHLATGMQSGTIGASASPTQTGGIMVQGPGGANAAYMAFHRPGAHAAFFGIDTDNVFKVGGWSMGATSYPIAIGNSGTYALSITGNAATATTAAACSGNAATATLATKASTLAQSGGSGAAMTFLWSGQSGQPSWLWGSNDGSSHYVYNPSNFNVASAAACSGNAATVTHNHSRTDGTPYPIVWAPAASNQPLYSGNNVTITSSTGLINCGALTATGEVTAFSDVRIKTDIKHIEHALDKVDALNGVTYTRTDEAHKGQRQTGLIAQEVQAVLPEAVIEDRSGMLSLAYGNLVGLLVEAIKELRTEVETLKARA